MSSNTLQAVLVPSQVSPLSPPHRRKPIACSNCRKRKIKCTPSNPSHDLEPCSRCLRRGFRCEYMTVSQQTISEELEQTSPGGSQSRTGPHQTFEPPSHEEYPPLCEPFGAPSYVALTGPSSYMPNLGAPGRSVLPPSSTPVSPHWAPGICIKGSGASGMYQVNGGHYVPSPTWSGRTQPICTLCSSGACYCYCRE
ncbi:hypothetical protein B0H17DRAFT_318555 [Mycena rosella]|uniref:Zn(2)-C6 fungal-type domain-containing protein n=1 Tax=Mycena rosella TaxID=1033263 RepID=A0AAD7CWZ9_MYCRO|nr:hypothetical protein B0H17DRAFT_318555 [Mycena rosella]